MVSPSGSGYFGIFVHTTHKIFYQVVSLPERLWARKKNFHAKKKKLKQFTKASILQPKTVRKVPGQYDRTIL